MEDEFWKQASGSGAANIATTLVFFLFWVVRNKCKHSKCVGRSLCCQLEINDDESEPKDVEFREEIKIQMQELHRRLDKSLPGGNKTIVQID